MVRQSQRSWLGNAWGRSSVFLSDDRPTFFSLLQRAGIAQAAPCQSVRACTRARARHRQAERVHEESLGSYATAQQAAEDLADGHTFSLPGGIDASDLGIPNDLAGWEKIPPEA